MYLIYIYHISIIHYIDAQFILLMLNPSVKQIGDPPKSRSRWPVPASFTELFKGMPCAGKPRPSDSKPGKRPGLSLVGGKRCGETAGTSIIYIYKKNNIYIYNIYNIYIYRCCSFRL
jgi:hypothetical protein